MVSNFPILDEGPRVSRAALLNSIASACPVAMVASDSSGGILLANPAYCQLVGCAPEELPGSLLSERFPELHDLYRDSPATAPESQSFDCLRGGRRDPHVLRIDVAPFLADGWLHFITANNRSENQRYLELVLNTTPEAGLLIDCDGRPTKANQACLEMLGLANEEALESLDLQGMILAAHREAFAALHARIVRGETGKTTLELQTPGAEARWVEWRGAALPAPGGNGLMHLAMLRDVTGRLEQDRQLRESEAMFRGLFENVSVGVYRSTPDRGVIAANPEMVQMLGFESEAAFRAYGIGDDLYLNPSVRTMYLQQLADSGEVRNAEVVLRRRDGRLINVLANVRAVRDASGEVQYHEGSVTDVTEQRRMADALESQQAVLERIARGTPLRPLLEDWCRIVERLLGAGTIALVDLRGGNRRLVSGRPLSAAARAVVMADANDHWVDDECYVSDTLEAPTWRWPDGAEAGDAVRAYWACLLRSADAQPIGKIVMVAPTPRAARPETRRVIRGAAQVAAIAVDTDTAAHSRNQMLSLLEATTDMVYITDARGQVCYCNAAARERLSIAADEDPGALFSGDFVTAEGRRYVEETALPKAREQGSWSGEVTWLARDGTKTPTWQVIVAHRDEYGEAAYYSGIARDLTARKAAERALRVSEARSRLLVDHAAEAILVVAQNPFRIVDLNDKATDLFGRSRAEMLGIGPELLAPARQQNGRTSREVIAEHLRTSYRGSTSSSEFTFLHANGAAVICELHLNRLPSETEKLLRASIYDISVRKRAEDALRASEARFKGIFNRTLGFVCIVAPDFTVVDLNESSLTTIGVERQEVVGKLCWDGPWFCGLPDQRELIRRSLQRAAQGETVRELSEYRSADGAIRILDRTTMPIMGADGQLEMLLVEGRDVTERLRDQEILQHYARRLEGLSKQLLRAQESERRHIARELHDEIGQSLTALKFNLHAVRSQLEIGGEDSTFDDSTEIVENVLEQIRSLSLDLRPSMLDDLGLVATLRWYLARQADRSGLKAEFIVDDPELRLAQDIETAFYRIAQEAINNAIKHANAARISLSLTTEEDWAELIVEDDGGGFDVRHSSKKAGQGGSFGLLGMQERAALVGGKLEIVSGASGSRVCARVPMRLPGATGRHRRLKLT